MIINLKSGLRVTTLCFFISKNLNNANKTSIYHLIHEFSDLEEIQENFSEISSNVRMLRFINKFNSLHKEKFFATINCFDTGKFLGNDINLPSDLKIINLNQYLLNKISNKINIKVLIKIEF